MDGMEKRELICQTGRTLLEERLVARTWGNVSCRADDDSFYITPSGLDYTKTAPEDIVRYYPKTKEFTGTRKPSSEKGIHAAAYELFPEVNFVIHTHQTYASALGLTGLDSLSMTELEKARLGGVAVAGYGLPGTGTLKNAVRAALSTGAHVVLMIKHGALICGTDHDDAMARARLLEEIARRSCKHASLSVKYIPENKALSDKLAAAVREDFPLAAVVATPALLRAAARKTSIRAQLDDMAQMMGASLPCVPARAGAVRAALRRHNAALIPGVGAIVCGRDEDDTEALGILANKAAVCALHTAYLGTASRVGALDTAIMRFVYTKKYSKKKG